MISAALECHRHSDASEIDNSTNLGIRYAEEGACAWVRHHSGGVVISSGVLP
jgi:hypothetical protein